jgi:hypothetical protein
MSFRIVFPFLLVSLVTILSAPSLGYAQLTNTTWNESLSLSADATSGGQPGQDSDLPEPLLDNLNGSQYSVDGSISFGPPGPPQATCVVNGSYTSGLNVYLGGTAYVRIDFTFQVRQTSSPPVTVGAVPINVHAAGSVSASGDAAMFANALSSFELYTFQGPLVSYDIMVSNGTGGNSDSFNEMYQTSLAPELTVSGAMTASANVGAEALQPNTQGNATAFIDPVIEVVDDVIPGTSSSYRDYFDIEFGSGYFALDTVPAEPATWGQIKTRFGN